MASVIRTLRNYRLIIPRCSSRYPPMTRKKEYTGSILFVAAYSTTLFLDQFFRTRNEMEGANN
jgi:hypothetical protein